MNNITIPQLALSFFNKHKQGNPFETVSKEWTEFNIALNDIRCQKFAKMTQQEYNDYWYKVHEKEKNENLQLRFF